MPEACKTTPIHALKCLDIVPDKITPEEKVKAEQNGVLDITEYENKVGEG